MPGAGWAAAYVRVSTTKASQKDSPEHQRGLCEEKARALGIAIDFVFEDRDSGTSIVGRPEIRRMIDEAGCGRFGTIIFASLSRFSRDTFDSLALKRSLVDVLGLRLISIEEGYDSAKDDDELKFQILSAVNQKLSEQISLSSRRGIRQSALRGNYTGSITPYGYRKAVADGRKTLLPDEDTAPVVRMIFEQYTAGAMGEKAIAAMLNGLEIPASRGGRWGVSSIQRILTNEVYAGQNVFCKYEVKKVYNNLANMTDRSRKLVMRDRKQWERSGFMTHPQIVSAETFERAQQVRLQRGGGKRGGARPRINVFAGLMFCSHCGSAIVCVKSAGAGEGSSLRERRYLVCSARRRQGAKGCENSLWLPYAEVRDGILEMLRLRLGEAMKSAVPVEALIAELAEPAEPDDTVEAGRLEAAVGVRRRLLYELRKQRAQGELDERQYAFESALCERELQRLLARMEQLRAQAELVQVEGLRAMSRREAEAREALRQLAELRCETPEELRAVLFRLVHRISVDRSGAVEVQSPLG